MAMRAIISNHSSTSSSVPASPQSLSVPSRLPMRSPIKSTPLPSESTSTALASAATMTSVEERDRQSPKVDALIFTTLQQFWRNYTESTFDAASNSSESDTESKEHWLRLFLLYFQLVTDEQLECDEDFRSFFNLIPEEICSFLLERVYEIISKSDMFMPLRPAASHQSPSPLLTSSAVTPYASVAGTKDESTITTLASVLSSASLVQEHNEYENEECRHQSSVESLSGKRVRCTVRPLPQRKKHNFAQLILRTPNDCNKVVALRNFLTNQLGQHLLFFLLRVDIKLIASQKSLCSLCVNLFPNCSWSDSAKSNQVPPPLLSRSGISTYVGNLSLFYQESQMHAQRASCQKPTTPLQYAAPPHSTNVECSAVADCIDATDDLLKHFDECTRNSDEIADLLARLMAKCVANECERTLSEHSMSVTALNFALDALHMPSAAFIGGRVNETTIKLRLLHLVELSLNNLFANAENVAVIQFPYVFVKLISALEDNNTAGAEVDIVYALISIVFGVLHNLVAICGSRNPNFLYCEAARAQPSVGGTRGSHDLKFIETGVVHTCVAMLKQHASAASTADNGELKQLFDGIISVLLRIIDHLNDYSWQHTATNRHSAHNHVNTNGGGDGGGAILQRLREARYKGSRRQQHCVGLGSDVMPNLNCSLQGALLGMLPQLGVDMQQLAVRYLVHAGTCCCHYTLATYDCCLQLTVRMASAYQRWIYKFLQRKLLTTVLAREEEGYPIHAALSVRRRQQNGQRRHKRQQQHHHHHYCSNATYGCAQCDAKAKSQQFHAGLLRLYCHFYETKLASPADDSSSRALSLCTFLQHLRSIPQMLTHELAAGILAGIVLPIFRQQKTAIMARAPHKCHCNDKNCAKDGDGADDGDGDGTGCNECSGAAAAMRRRQERLLHECLCICSVYMSDIRLIKDFYNEENIAHLEDLLAVPALIRDVCHLIKLGIDNLTFLGDNAQEQMRVSRRLIMLQLESSHRAAQIFQSLLKRLQAHNSLAANNLWLDEVTDFDVYGSGSVVDDENNNDGNDDGDDLYHKSRLSALDTLNMVTLQWTLNYELLRTSPIFCQQFGKIYAVDTDTLSHKAAKASPSKPSTLLREMNYASATPAAADHLPQGITNVLKLNFYALHCFLLLPSAPPPQTTTTAPATKVPHPVFSSIKRQHQQIANLFNVPKTRSATCSLPSTAETVSMAMAKAAASKTTPTDAETITGHNAIDCLPSSMETFVLSSTHQLRPVVLSGTAAALLQSTALTASTPNEWSAMEASDGWIIEHFCAPNLLNGYYSFWHGFKEHHELSLSDDDNANVHADESVGVAGAPVVLFDIRQQQRQTENCHTTTFAAVHRLQGNTGVEPKFSCCNCLTNSSCNYSGISLSALSLVSGCDAMGGVIGSSGGVGEPDINLGIIGRLFRMFGTLLTKATVTTPTSPRTPTAKDLERERRLAEETPELRECFCQANGDGKKLLLKLFEATMAICVKAYQNEDVEKMEKHLWKLKTIILSNANANWTQYAEQQQHTPRDNPVLQTLQALLRIAEFTENEVQAAQGIMPLLRTQTPTPAATATAGVAKTAPTTVDGDDATATATTDIDCAALGSDGKQQPPAQPRSRADSCLQSAVSMPLMKHNNGGACNLRSSAALTAASTRLGSDADDDDDDCWSDMEQGIATVGRPPAACDRVFNAYTFEDDNCDADVESGGYEADAEVAAASSSDVDADIATTTAADIWTAYTPSSRYRSHVLHAGLSRLVVELLMELTEHCVQKPMESSNGWCDSLEQLANRLFVIRDCLGGSLYLLRGFAPLLSSNDSRLSDLQESILKLITDLNTPDMLAAYFHLLTASAPPVDILVKYLYYNRITPLRKAQATVELEFPVVIDGKCISTADTNITIEIERIRNYHLHHQAQTAFTRAPCIIPLTHERLWGSNGVTISLWLQVNAPPLQKQYKSDSLTSENDDVTRSTIEECPRTHVVSIGTNLAMLCIYINSKMQLVFETCRPNGVIPAAALSPASQPHSQLVSATPQNNSSGGANPATANGTNQSANVVDVVEGKKVLAHGAAAGTTATPSPFRNALKQTKALLSFSFNQMHIFQSNGGHTFGGDGGDCGHHHQSAALDAAGHLPGATYYEGATVVLPSLRLTRQRWTHLTFAAQTHVNSLEVNVFVDGLEQHTVRLPFLELCAALHAHHAFQIVALGDGLPMKPPMASETGSNNNSNNTYNAAHSQHSTSTGSNSYSGSHVTFDVGTLRCNVTTLLLFNRCLDNRLTVANLTAMGPNYSELTACQLGASEPNYGYLNVTRMQRAHFGCHTEALKQLREARVLSYTAQQPDWALAYSGVGVHLDAGVTCGRPVGVVLYGELLRHQVSSLQTATILSGGLGALLYLFARVVELNASPATQAMALDLLLSVAHADAQLYAEFQQQDYMGLIGYVVRTEHCAKDAQLMRAIINNACTQPLVFERPHVPAAGATCNGANACLYVQQSTVACLVYPQLLVAVLQRYSDWQSSGVEQAVVLELLLHSVLALTRDKHPHRDFNMEQLSHARIVRQLLNLCKVHLLESLNPIHISVAAARAYVNVLAVFAGSPPSQFLMDEIMKLLLLLHRAAESFVTHDRCNFYFLLGAAKPPNRERATASARLGNRMVSSVFFQRRLLPGTAKPLSHSTGSSTDTAGLDPERAARIEQLRRLHMQRANPSGGGGMYRRALSDFENTLYSVADCSRLNRNALRTLSPDAVTSWHAKYKRAVAGAATPPMHSPKMLHRASYVPWASVERASYKARLNPQLLIAAAHSSGALGTLPRVNGRKRSRLQSSGASKRLRTRTERSAEDSGLQSLAASLTLAIENYRNAAVGTATPQPRKASQQGEQRHRRRQRPYKSTTTSSGYQKAEAAATGTASTPPPNADFHSTAGVVALQEGLLTLLKDFLYLLPDNVVEEVLHHYVKLDFLLVLANHQSCAVRAAIIRLLAALTKRLSAAELQTACSKHYFAHHVANQLCVYGTDAAMFLACVEWVTGLYGGTIEAVFAHMNGLRVQHRFGINALLAVAARSAAQPQAGSDQALPLPLPGAAFKVLHSMFQMQPEEQTTLLEAGLLQCCTRALYNVYACGQRTPATTASEEAVLELLTTVGTKALKSAGQINLLWDIQSMLAFYQERQAGSIVYGFRAAQAQLLLNLLRLYFDGDTLPLPSTKGGFKTPSVGDCTLPSSEMRARFDLLIDRCVQFFTAQNDVDILSGSSGSAKALLVPPKDGAFDTQEALTPSEPEMRLFELLATYGIASNQRCVNFIAWGLLPSRPRELRAFIVDALWQTCRNDTLPAIICDGKMLRSLLLLCLLEDLEQPIANLQPLCDRLGIHENESAMLSNVESEHERVRLSARAAAEHRRTLAEKIAFKLEALATGCYETALLLTRRVTELQNAERKLIMGHLRDYDKTTSYTQWRDLICRMTHEGAVWHSTQHSENCWELDDTEGPSRVHTRLRRCHLEIDRRFIMPEYADDDAKQSSARESVATTPPHTPPVSTATAGTAPRLSEHKRPLEYLLATGYDQQLQVALNAQEVFHNFPAKYLPVDGEIDGELIVTEKRLYFVAMHRCRYFSLSCDVANISEIWLKRYQHQEKAFEIFLDTNRSMFFTLQHQHDWRALRELFCDKIVTLPDANKLQVITQQWSEGMLTNWEYLMTLNQLAGRTYNDLMQYPVFPWILSNYTSEMLDLTDKSNYRLMHKPIAVQHAANEQHYINTYAYINSTVTNMGSLILKPYHYSSHYSNSGTVLHFLVRVPPFTSYFLRYQDNNFDLPDRTFHALNTTWNLASRDSPTDIKELIPEFFCLPEMFENFANLNFGCRQSGERVEDVQLPPWCRGDGRLFVLIHRQALESEAVRYSLHAWIDLIFGYKQMGEAAVEAINVFHPATYPIFLESEDISDPIERKAVETMVRTYGQMPRQLFKAPHPASRPLSYNLGQPQQVLPGSAVGLRWGVYVGSPQLPAPQRSSFYELCNAEKLVAFPSTNVVYGLEKRESIMQGAELDTYNVISWGHSDRIVRIEPLNKRPYTRPRNLLYDDSFDEITACGTDPNCNQLWFGHKSGRISVYRCTSSGGGAAGGTAANGSRLLKARRQSYVRGLYMSYNSAFRKITNASASAATTKAHNCGDADCCDDATADGGGADGGASMGLTAAVAATSSSNATTAAGADAGGGVGAAVSASATAAAATQQRENGTDLQWHGPTILTRHTDEITYIALSVEFKIAVTAARDGMAVIWDLNDWRYVRTIERPAEIRQSAISLAVISPTLGDIVTIHTIPQQQQQQAHDDNAASLPTATAIAADECFEVTEENHGDFVKVSVNPNGRSILRLHTVNARYVQHVVHEYRILAACFSYIKEGVGVNCIATAIEGGVVRLWSTWNLNLITEIATDGLDVVSLTYSTHQHLVTLTRNSCIQVWEADGLYGAPPKFPQIAYK